MSKINILLILLVVLLMSLGQILFKMSANNIDIQTPSSLLSIKLFLGLFLYLSATILWMNVLRFTPLNIAYPLTSLAFIIVPILSYFLIGEQLTFNNFFGSVLIFIGVWISTL